MEIMSKMDFFYKNVKPACSFIRVFDIINVEFPGPLAFNPIRTGGGSY